MPINLEMCCKATKYTVVRRMKEYTGGGDGFEIVKIIDSKENGLLTQHVHRITHFKTQIPRTFRWIVPEKYAHVHAYHHIAFPHYEGDFTIPAMGDSFILHTETNHIEYNSNNEIPNNINNWNEEEIKDREIFYLDILNGPISKASELDLHGYSCPEIMMSELFGNSKWRDDKKVPIWVSNYDGPITLIIKTVKFKFEWYGLQTLVEKGVVNCWYQVYLNLHRAMVKL